MRLAFCRADEADCQVCQAQEVCSNGKDDNCDCVVDNPPPADDPCNGDPSCGVQ